MPNKPSPVSRPTQPAADGYTDTKPAKGFQKVVARIAKPLKGLGLGGGGRPASAPSPVPSVNHAARIPNSLGGPVAEWTVSAEDVASIERSLAITAASLKVNDVFDPSNVAITEIKREIVSLKTLAKKTLQNITELDRQLNLIPPMDMVEILEVKLKKMNYQDLERDTHIELNKSYGRLHEAIDSRCAELQKKIDFWSGKMPEGDELGKQSLHMLIAAAENQQLKLRLDRAEWQG